jgi:Fur family transcriptional regulator, ferric uptake regulator
MRAYSEFEYIMKPVHNKEKEHFKKLFHREHIDRFEDRFKILEVFLQTEKHITAQEMHRLLTENGIHLTYEFLKQTLDMMCRYGFAQKRKFQDGQIRYEHRHLGQHHDHMICTRCGNILEFVDDDLEQLQLKIAAARGFHILQHKMEIYGICAECQAHRAELIPLSNAKPGERLVIKEFGGGKMSQMRLISMGLRQGEKVDVITSAHQGQVVIAIGYNRLSIGQGLARKVLVKPVSGS